MPMFNIITESVLKERIYRKSAVTPCKMSYRFLATIFKNKESNGTRQCTVSQNLKYLQEETLEHGKHSDCSQMSSCITRLTMKVREMNCDVFQ